MCRRTGSTSCRSKAMGIVGIALAVWTTCSSARTSNTIAGGYLFSEAQSRSSEAYEGIKTINPSWGTQGEVDRRARSVETGRQQDDRAGEVVGRGYPRLLLPEIEADEDALATVLAFVDDCILLHADETKRSFHQRGMAPAD